MQKFGLLACYPLVFATASITFAQAAQQNPSRPFGPRSCGPVDPSYIRVAEDTGGIPFFFHRSEVAQSTKFMLASTGENRVTLLWAKGSLQNNTREFLVPIDSTIEQIVFTLSTDNPDMKMEVFGSDNTPITAESHAEATDFTCGRFIIMRKPSAGSYRVRVQGSGRFWVSVEGKSEIFLHGVEFVELGGRPGHEGMFRIHGQPLIGKPANLEAGVAGDARKVSFALVTPENQVIQLLNLRSVQGDQDSHEFAGEFPLPNEPFRLVAMGTDQNGQYFQRVHAGLFRPTSIALALVNAPDISAGANSALTFQMTNFGATGRFHLVAICANTWTARVDPTDISLSRGEAAKLLVTVFVPQGTPAYTGGDLVLTATSDNDPTNTNGVVHHLSVEPVRK
jgi:von Willebrand factor A domain-containing protein 7